MNYKQRAKDGLDVNRKAVLKEDKKGKVVKASDPQKYAKTVAPKQLCDIERELAEAKELILKHPKRSKLQEVLARTEANIADLQRLFNPDRREVEMAKSPTELVADHQANEVVSKPIAALPMPRDFNSPKQSPQQSDRLNSSELYIPPPVMMPGLQPPATRYPKKKRLAAPSELVAIEEKVMACNVQLSSLLMFNPIKLEKTQKENGIWSATTTNPLVALSVKYFDIANQRNREALLNIKEAILRKNLDWALSNGDIEMNITTVNFTSGEYVQKLFVEMLDRLTEESALSLLQNYDLTERVFKVAIKVLLMGVNAANERSDFDNVFRPEEVMRLYKALQHIMGMKATIKKEVVTIEIQSRFFRIEMHPDHFETYLEEQTHVSHTPLFTVIERSERPVSSIDKEDAATTPPIKRTIHVPPPIIKPSHPTPTLIHPPTLQPPVLQPQAPSSHPELPKQQAPPSLSDPYATMAEPQPLELSEEEMEAI